MQSSDKPNLQVIVDHTSVWCDQFGHTLMWCKWSNWQTLLQNYAGRQHRRQNKHLSYWIFLRNIKIYLHFISSINNDVPQVVEIISCRKKESFILINQWHGGWRPGDSRIQGIIHQGNGPVITGFWCQNDLCIWASCQIRAFVGCACAGNAGNVFPATVG